MTIRVDEIMLTEAEVQYLADGGAMTKQTDRGAKIWLYGESGTSGAQPQGTWKIPVGDFMIGELCNGSRRTGYAGNGYPFVLGIGVQG